MGDTPDLSPALERAISDYPPAARARFMDLRDMIYDQAQSDPRIGTLRETLKWGEPSFIPEASRSGTTLRLAWKSSVPDVIQMLVPCSTSLVDNWRAHYGEVLNFQGQRAAHIPLSGEIPLDALRHCAQMALTYHLRKLAS